MMEALGRAAAISPVAGARQGSHTSAPYSPNGKETKTI